MQALKRKRARLACKPCRDRKRKCDSGEPCVTCTTWGYECYYEAQPRKSRTNETLEDQSEPRSSPKTAAGPSTVESDQSGMVRRLEANSGAAFVRKLGLKIDPAKAPKLNLFGWNIGTRKLSAQTIPTTGALSIIEITSLDHMKALAQVYFDKVDPCYGFIDRHDFFARLDARWLSPLISDIYDSVLSGVAAIGCLFSQRNASTTELHLVRTASYCLDMHRLSGPPSLDLLTGWVLRSIYLRLTDSPYSTWVASSTLMHLLEAAGLHPRGTRKFSSSPLPSMRP
ncbi:hypothetical protein N7454_001212 [Penicillium verhagenii]|nr:hypothetical protein N7454_001212 [Penicillium verhagenii]